MSILATDTEQRINIFAIILGVCAKTKENLILLLILFLCVYAIYAQVDKSKYRCILSKYWYYVYRHSCVEYNFGFQLAEHKKYFLRDKDVSP